MPQASPSQVHADILRTSPLTSVRRSISNLTADGKLVKTERKVQGPYGRPEYVWRLAGDARQRNLF
jgi:predicted ArsR family transcriptional regulator